MNNTPLKPEDLLEQARARYPGMKNDNEALVVALESEIEYYRAKIKRMQMGRSESEKELREELEGYKRTVDQLETELRIADSDKETLKNTIVRMVMRIEGAS